MRDDRQTRARRVVAIVLVLNLAVAAAKLAYGYAARAVALQADGLHSLLDAFANVVGLVGLRYAAAPPDGGHPYGHRRIEHLAAAGVGVLILAGVVEVAHGTWDTIAREGRPRVDAGGFAVILGTLVVNAFVARWEARRGRDLESAFLVADSHHTRSDVFATLVVLVSYVGAYYGVRWADPVAAGVVMVLIARAGLAVLRENVPVLVDAAAIDARRVREVVTAVAGVEGCHKLRSRGSPDAVHIDLHIQVDPHMSVLDGHALSHRVKDAILEQFPEVEDVLVHLEPDVPEERHG